MGKGKGRAVLRVKWPTTNASRLIPASAESLVITAKLGGQAVGSATLDRPDSTATLTGLPYGNLTVEVRAYSDLEGKGSAQAFGTGTMAVGEGAPGTAAVSLASTITHFVGSTATVRPGLTSGMTISARDAGDAIVPIPDDTVTWTIDDPSIATISGTGPVLAVKGVAEGTSLVRCSMVVDDAGHVVTGVGRVLVSSSQPQVAVSPPTVTLGIGQSVRFTSTGIGTLQWSADGGTIDADGNYKTANAPGVYAVTATYGNVALPGVAQVTVKPWVSVASPGGFVPDDAVQHLSARVITGPRPMAQDVTWTASAGTIAADGTYTPTPGAGADATITATSVADPSLSGTVTVNVRRLVISPPAVSINYKTVHDPRIGTYEVASPSFVPFTLSGSLAGDVTWQTSYGNGTVNAKGVYTPPSPRPGPFALVTATSGKDPSAKASAQITLN